MMSAFQVESADLTAYGLIPEFVGRFPILVSLSALTEDQLIRVITSFIARKCFTMFLIVHFFDLLMLLLHRS